MSSEQQQTEGQYRMCTIHQYKVPKEMPDTSRKAISPNYYIIVKSRIHYSNIKIRNFEILCSVYLCLHAACMQRLSQVSGQRKSGEAQKSPFRPLPSLYTPIACLSAQWKIPKLTNVSGKIRWLVSEIKVSSQHSDLEGLNILQIG